MTAETPAQRRTAAQMFAILLIIGHVNVAVCVVMAVTSRWLMALVFFSLYVLFQAVLALFRDNAEMFDTDGFGNPRRTVG